MGYRESELLGIRLYRELARSLGPSSGEGASYGNLLNTHQFQRSACATVTLQTELNHLADSFHQHVEVLRLCVAAPQTWHVAT
jgi:hypothetical protein